jgi:peptidoglycan hydrolase CwlO-like protein
VCVLIVVGGTLLNKQGATKMTIEISVLVGIVSVAFAIYFGIKSSRRTDAKDVEDRATKNAEINFKLDNISSNVSDIKYDISATRKKVDEIDKRVIVVEQSSKSAHHRLDRLEGRDERDA